MGENLHSGHRERLRTRFLEGENLADHELLELLLYYAIPQQNTNELAHSLINKCGNLAGVFKADIEFLKNIKGLNTRSACLLVMILELFKRYQEINLQIGKRTDYRHIGEYFVNKFVGETNEMYMCVVLNEDLYVKNCAIIGNGSIGLAPVNVREIVDFTYKQKSNIIVLAHNHPNGNPTPSQEDVATTRYLSSVLRPVDIILVDHIVVAGNDYVSLKQAGKMFYI
jgi:DNA repair protein RadC